MHGQPRALTLTTPPVNLPLSLGEIKAELNLPDSDDSSETQLLGTLRACTQACERFTRRTFITSTLTAWHDRFPGQKLPWWDGVRQGADTELSDLSAPIVLLHPPILAVTSVTTHLEDGSSSVVASTVYFVDSASEPGRLLPNVSQSWPSSSLRVANGIEIIYTAGYGPVGSDVPQAIREAIMMCVVAVHSIRGGEVAKREKVGESEIDRFDPEQIPLQAQHLLNTYKIWKL